MSFRYTMIGAAVCIFIFYLGLILSLFYFAGGKGFWEALSHPNTLFSIRLSLIAATVATFFAVLIGLPSAYALSRFNFFGKQRLGYIFRNSDDHFTHCPWAPPSSSSSILPWEN